MTIDLTQGLVLLALVFMLALLVFQWLNSRQTAEQLEELQRVNVDQHTQLDRLNETVHKQQQHLAHFNETAVLQQASIQTLNESTIRQVESLQALSATAATQQQNLSAMEKRIVEIERAGDLYKSLFEEVPVAIEKYRDYMTRIKEQMQQELNGASGRMDEHMRRYKERELEDIESREKLIADLPQLIVNLHEVLDPVNERLKLFSDRDKYPTGSLLSVSARRGKSLLAAIGEQSSRTGLHYGDTPVQKNAFLRSEDPPKEQNGAEKKSTDKSSALATAASESSG